MARFLSADDTRFIVFSSLFFCHLFLQLLFLSRLNSVRLCVPQNTVAFMLQRHEMLHASPQLATHSGRHHRPLCDERHRAKKEVPLRQCSERRIDGRDLQHARRNEKLHGFLF